MESAVLPYKRVLYKISGEALALPGQSGYDFDSMISVANDIKQVCAMGVSVCLVIGGGNLCRGSAIFNIGMERVVGDYMGMLATIMNAVAMQNILEKQCDISARVLSAVAVKTICEPYIRRRALRHVEKGRVVIFAAGTGSPFFTTDTGAVLRAVEMKCDIVFKGTSVDGVYSADPKEFPDASRYDNISYDAVLNGNLRFMDQAAVALARDNSMPISVFSIKRSTTPLLNVMLGNQSFTTVS